MTTTDISPEPEWLTRRRDAARGRSASLDLPQYKGGPGWEFTPLKGLDLDAFAPAPGGPADALEETTSLWEVPAEHVRLTQVDGRPFYAENGHAPETPTRPVVLPLSVAAARHPELVERHLGTVVPETDAFVARNEAEWTGGAFVYVPVGQALETPVQITATQAEPGTQLNFRTLIVLEEGAQAEVWEQYLSADGELEGVFNTVVELSVGANAHLRYINGQGLSERSWIFGSQRAEVGRDGSLEWLALGFGSGRGKVRMETKLAGQGSSAKVTGAYAGHARQHLDFDTTQEHAAANTTSDLAFRGVLQDRSTSVWRGMIKVDPGAQQTDAFQENRNLLLSKRAHADAIPGLEILANDVRCTHAAAIAQVDPDQLFYLMARGLSREEGTRLVIEGFMAELVERFPDGPVREAVAGALDRRLAVVLDRAGRA